MTNILGKKAARLLATTLVTLAFTAASAASFFIIIYQPKAPRSLLK
ncbi:MAG: cyclic lactone autoinducer peptide [Clostridiales bacterium]|nr:cyclic lactone autoinducer peptide [Clostridiales bacterium]